MLFCSCVFGPLSIAITSLGEERANLSAFRAFVIVALPGLVCYLSFFICDVCFVIICSSSLLL